MATILLTNKYSEGPLNIIKNLVPKGFEVKTLSESSKQVLLESVSNVDYILAGGRLVIDYDVISNALKLKMIQRTGVGLDAIDLDALQNHHIPLYVNKGINADSVAEHTILLILALLRRLTIINAEMHSGKWNKQGNGIKNFELKGKTVGLIGMGAIGRREASLLSAFNANVLYYDVFRLSEQDEKMLSVNYTPFEELLTKVDILSFHCALTDQTRNLLNRDTINLLKEGVLVINTARGGLIDEFALYDALLTGHIAGAGLDVHAKEPIDINNPFVDMPNVILTPHIGGVTYDSFRDMIAEAMHNIECFENGKLDLIKDKLYRI